MYMVPLFVVLATLIVFNQAATLKEKDKDSINEVIISDGPATINISSLVMDDNNSTNNPNNKPFDTLKAEMVPKGRSLEVNVPSNKHHTNISIEIVIKKSST